MFERFTDQARRVTVVASEEAQGYGNIHTGHLLLGLLNPVLEDTIAYRALHIKQITAERVRAEIIALFGERGEQHGVHTPFSSHCKKILELALREALQLGHNYIGTEHLLLAIIRDGTFNPTDPCSGARIINALEVDLGQLRRTTIELLVPDAMDTEIGKKLPELRSVTEIMGELNATVRRLDQLTNELRNHPGIVS